MNFDFSTDQYMLRDSVRSFLADRWGPRKLRQAGTTFDDALWQGLCDLGLQTLLIPEEHGGAGLGPVDLVLVLEEFGRALVPPAMAETILASDAIARHGTPAQRAALLPLIAAGDARIAFAHRETGRGHTAAEIGLQARQHGSQWRLQGSKILVPCAAAATHFLVSARVPGGNAALFIVEAATPAVQVRTHRAVDSFSLLGEVTFDAVAAQPVGAAPDTLALERLLESSTFCAAAQMVGVAAMALDIAVAYAKERTQFGRPIGSFQAIKHKCADMLVALECARSAAYYAAWAIGEEGSEQALAVSMAKAVCGDACGQICADALQVHGGVGFTWEFDIHLYLRRAKLLQHSCGDATAHRERVAINVLDTMPHLHREAVAAVVAALP